MEIYLIRHGETEYNVERRYQGSRDISLSEIGKAKLRKAEFDLDTVYVTPMCRTAQTAKILFPDAQQIPVFELREMNFGVFEGKNHEELKSDPIYQAWVESEWMTLCPQGETRDEFSERTCGALEKLIDQGLEQGKQKLVIVAHGGTQMAALERFCQPKRGYAAWLTGNGGGYVLSTERWKAEHILSVAREVNYGEEK